MIFYLSLSNFRRPDMYKLRYFLLLLLIYVPAIIRSSEARPSYHIIFDWGKLSAEALLAYTYLSSINNFAFGADLGLEFGHIKAKFGYYYRMYGIKRRFLMTPVSIFSQIWVQVYISIAP